MIKLTFNPKTIGYWGKTNCLFFNKGNGSLISFIGDKLDKEK
jgi:hypothetical protein